MSCAGMWGICSGSNYSAFLGPSVKVDAHVKWIPYGTHYVRYSVWTPQDVLLIYCSTVLYCRYILTVCEYWVPGILQGYNTRVRYTVRSIVSFVRTVQ